MSEVCEPRTHWKVLIRSKTPLTSKTSNMKILESLKAVEDCTEADLIAILAVLESTEVGYGREDEATGSFVNLDATELGLNQKKRNIIKAAVRAASSQGIACCSQMHSSCTLHEPAAARVGSTEPIRSVSLQICSVAAAHSLKDTNSVQLVSAV